MGVEEVVWAEVNGGQEGTRDGNRSFGVGLSFLLIWSWRLTAFDDFSRRRLRIPYFAEQTGRRLDFIGDWDIVQLIHCTSQI